MLLKKYKRVNNFDKFVIIFYQNNEHFHNNERYDQRKSETRGGNGRDASGTGPSTNETLFQALKISRLVFDGYLSTDHQPARCVKLYYVSCACNMIAVRENVASICVSNYITYHLITYHITE